MDTSSFAGSKDPFGSVAMDPSRDFFQPLSAQPTTSFSAPTIGAPPPSMPPPAPAGFATFCQRNMGIFAAAALVIALGIAGYMVYHARNKAAAMKGPYNADIMKVQDAERRDDLLELQYLWQISRRSSVKQMLGDTLNSAVAGETTPAAPPAQPAAEADPFFTAA